MQFKLFLDMAEFTSSFYSTKLHANVKGVSARGGASIIEVCP